MKPTITLLFALLCSTLLSAQTSGTALLDNQTDHSGILVRFTPVSPSGQADSALTNSAGQYSINLQSGVYTVEFSKADYLTVSYENGLPLLLGGTNVNTLQSVTLPGGNYKFISGEVHGTFFADTIYYLTSNGIVPDGKTLTLLPGAEVQFADYYELKVYGQIFALGAPGNEVRFSLGPLSTEPNWKSIYVEGMDTAVVLDTAIFRHCIFSDGEYAVQVQEFNTSPPTYFEFQDNVVENFIYDGVFAYGEVEARIMGNEFNNCAGSSVNLAIYSNATGEVRCNNIHNGGLSGVSTFASEGDINIVSNYIHDMSAHGSGVRAQPASGLTTVRNNLIVNSYTGISDATHVQGALTTIIENNIVSDCELGISLGAFGSSSAEMNVIRNCSSGVHQSFFAVNPPISVAYNSLFGNTINFDNVLLPGLETLATTNANGDSTDLWLNIFSDPLITGINTWYPGPGSPLLNAGNPNAPLDPDNSSADIGLRQIYVTCTNLPELGSRIATSSVEAASPSDTDRLVIAPNPSSGEFLVRSSVRVESVTAYSLDGRRIALQNLGDDQYALSQVPAGIYVLRVQTKEGIATRRLVIQ